MSKITWAFFLSAYSWFTSFWKWVFSPGIVILTTQWNKGEGSGKSDCWVLPVGIMQWLHRSKWLYNIGIRFFKGFPWLKIQFKLGKSIQYQMINQQQTQVFWTYAFVLIAIHLLVGRKDWHVQTLTLDEKWGHRWQTVPVMPHVAKMRIIINEIELPILC